jgi:acetylornithine deacetylase/succinyl-diaminopimelate desuccinylase-like protein
VRSLQRNAGLVQERDDLPALTCGYGFTDVRFYRVAGVPDAYYGPRPHNMGSQSEYTSIDDLVETMQVHAATAAEFFDDS